MNKQERNVGRLFTIIAVVFCLILLCFSVITIYTSYHDKRSRVLTSMEMVETYADQEYNSIIANFWQAYIPFYQADAADKDIVNRYFSTGDPITPMMKNRLSALLEKVRMRDNRIQWIAFYSPNRTEAYIQYYGSATMFDLPSDFPWLEDVKNKRERMEVYGQHRLTNSQVDADTFAIAGGVPYEIGSGSVLIGYETATIAAAARLLPANVSTAQYYVISNDQIVYHSADIYDSKLVYKPEKAQTGVMRMGERRIYVTAALTGNDSSFLVCAIDNADLLLAAHRHTPLLLVVILAFFAFSALVYHLVRVRVADEVGVIKRGLDILSENNLEYRLPLDFRQSGFREIAQDINNMSSLLDESIRKAYYFEIKQKDAEMAELQATINPHFLYNTLEMLRNKAYSNGDEDTAALIADLASIFRGFIGAKTFVPLREELASCRKYMKLLAARYGDVVEFDFDIDTELLEYGIIRNVFQLLVENYFVHGLDTNRRDNEIHFIGRSKDDTDIMLYVEDNGFGMKNDDLMALNQKIEQPIRHSNESYGLKNLNQRLKLFYGSDYGIQILKNEFGGLTIAIRIRKITVEEYEHSHAKIDLQRSVKESRNPYITN